MCINTNISQHDFNGAMWGLFWIAMLIMMLWPSKDNLLYKRNKKP